MTMSEENKTDFYNFLKSLRDAGCKHLHIVAHSIGALILFKAVNDICEHIEQLQEKNTNKIMLETVMLLNPDCSLHEFLTRDFINLKRYCNHITLYADHTDNALKFSEFFNRWKALGKHPFDLFELGISSTEKNPLDLDVIDVSRMDYNQNSMRHCFFLLTDG
jgi:esterase/lipase superfamily enzyme